MDKSLLINEFETAKTELSDYIDKSFKMGYANAVFQKIAEYYDTSLMKGIVAKEEQVFFLDYLKTLQSKMREQMIASMKSAGEENESVAMSYWYLAEGEVDRPELIPLQADFDFSAVPPKSQSAAAGTGARQRRSGYKPSASDWAVSGGSAAVIICGAAAPLPPVAKVVLIGVGAGGLVYEGVKYVRGYSGKDNRSNERTGSAQKQVDQTQIIKSICISSIKESAEINADSLKKWMQTMFDDILSKVRD